MNGTPINTVPFTRTAQLTPGTVLFAPTGHTMAGETFVVGAPTDALCDEWGLPVEAWWVTRHLSNGVRAYEPGELCGIEVVVGDYTPTTDEAQLLPGHWLYTE